MNEDFYNLYKITKRFIERTEAWCKKHNDYELMNQDWKNAIASFDAAGRGYAERYEKEKNNECAV